MIEMSSQTDIRQDWENLQQPTERVVIEMLSQSDIRQDCENVQQPTERVLIEMSVRNISDETKKSCSNQQRMM